MRAYYHDNADGDVRLPHDTGKSVDEQQLKDIGVLAFHFDDIEGVNGLAKERKYVSRDEVTITPQGMGGEEIYQQKLKIFYAEHLHEDEEIRYILDGDGYFDVRSDSDDWIRVHLEKGDMLILPAGIYHRFTLSDKDYIKTMRLFQEEPKWIPHNRPCDENDYRVKYLESIRAVQV